MAVVSLALLAASLGAPPDPFPDGKSTDALHYSFSSRVGSRAGPHGFLRVTADGKVKYAHRDPGSMIGEEKDTTKEFTLTKDEHAELFRKLVADGLLELPESKDPIKSGYWFTVWSGRWQRNFVTDALPEKLLAHLRPLLVKAHPEAWEKKEGGKDAEKVAELKPVFARFRYTFAQGPGGHTVELAVARDGTVTYKRATDPRLIDEQPKVVVKDEWKIPAKDAVALLDALTADGFFELKDARVWEKLLKPERDGPRPALDPPKQKERQPLIRPYYALGAEAGRWHTDFTLWEMPEKVQKHFLPLLKKADAEFWK